MIFRTYGVQYPQLFHAVPSPILKQIAGTTDHMTGFCHQIPDAVIVRWDVSRSSSHALLLSVGACGEPSDGCLASGGSDRQSEPVTYAKESLKCPLVNTFVETLVLGCLFPRYPARTLFTCHGVGAPGCCRNRFFHFRPSQERSCSPKQFHSQFARECSFPSPRSARLRTKQHFWLAIPHLLTWFGFDV